MAKLIGMGGGVSVAATEYAVTEWSIAVSNDIQDVTDTDSAGWTSRLAGVNSAEISFKAFWGAAASNLSTSFAIGTTVAFTLNIGSSAKSFTGNAIITSFTVTNGAKTPVEFQCTAMSDGAITMPA